MKNKKEKVVKEPKIKKQGKGRDFLVFIIIAFAMVFLTSSFIVEDVYSHANRLTMTPEGVKEVYEASIGKRTFVEETKNITTNTNNVEPTATPIPTPAATPAPTTEAIPEPTAAPSATAGQ